MNGTVRELPCGAISSSLATAAVIVSGAATATATGSTHTLEDVVENKTWIERTAAEIDLAAAQIIERDGIHRERETRAVHDAVVGSNPVGIGHPVRHPSAASATHENADCRDVAFGLAL